ncbi:hypothetical protein AB0K43_16550 [Kitasatospora sp. NPDC049258]|uniref:hypothetical protein n=1 Tax=Kitasatospora sp. NPDC049258 TaxID=3155394 RepID=UPI0034446D83
MRSKNQWPWAVKNGPTPAMYVTGEVVRIIIGGVVAWGLAEAGPLGALGALMAGAGAPAILDTWQRTGPQATAPARSRQAPRQATRASRGGGPAAQPSALEGVSASTASEGGA